MPPKEGTGETGQAAVGQDDKMVPLTALEGVRAELKESKEATQQLKGQVELYKANAAHTPVQEVTDDLDGLKEDDVVTVADVKRIMGTQTARFEAVANQLRAGQGAPDYEQTIEKYLPAVLAENPALAAAIKTSNNPVALALQLSKSSDAYRRDQQEKDLGGTKESTIVSEGQQILDNQNKPGAASAGAGAGGGVSNLDKMLAMTDEELEAKIAATTGG